MKVRYMMNYKVVLVSFLLIVISYAGDWMWDQNGPLFELDTIVEYLEIPPCGDCCHSCNVWLKSGGYTFSETDYSSRHYGPNIQIDRTYNSMDKSSGIMGEGWTVSIGRNIMALASQGDEFVVIRVNKGAEFKLIKEGEKYVYKGETIWPYELRKSDGKFILERKNGPTERSIFNSDGQLLEVVDNFGNRTVYSYTKNGMLREIKSDKKTITVDFGYNGKIQSITSSDDYKIIYSYNEVGQLENVRQTYEGVEISSVNYTYTEYTFKDYTHTFLNSRTNESGEVIETVDYFRDVEEKLIEDNGDLVLYVYFAYKVDKIYSKGDTYTYNYFYDEMKTTVTNLAGETWTYFYDEYGVQTLEIGPDGKEVIRESTDIFDENFNPKYEKVVDENGGEHYFSYDNEGQLTDYTDPVENQYFYTYNDEGRVKTITTPEGIVRTYTYTEEGRVSSVTEENPNQVEAQTRSMASFDDFKKTWYFKWNSKGLVDTVIDPETKVTAYEYDLKGDIAAIVKPGNLRYEYSINDKGLLEAFKGPDKNLWQYQYDVGSRWPNRVIDPLGNENKYEYDKRGNVKKITNTDSTSTTYEYDIYKRLMKTIDEKGHETKYGYKTILKQDILSSVTMPNGQKLLYNFNSRGDIVEKVLKVGDTSSTIDQDDLVTRFHYNGTGRVHVKILPCGRPQFFSYDKKGRIKSFAEYTDTTWYEYTASDKIKEITTSANNTYTMVYDKLGRLDTLKDNLGPISKYVYDKNDNVVSKEVFGANAATFEYNDAGFVTKQKSKNGYVMEYVYDSTGQLSKVQDSLGNVIEYGYDKLGRVVWQWPYNLDSLSYDTVKFAYNNVGRVESIVNSSGISTKYFYDDAGNKSIEISDDKDTTEFTHDELDRLKTKKLPGGLIITFKYDAAGRLEERSYSDGTPSDVFHYDKAGRMVHADNANAELYWSYDGDGKVVNHTIENKKTSSSGVVYGRDYKKNHDSIRVYFSNAPETDFVYKKDLRDRIDTIQTKDGNILCTFDYDGSNLSAKHLGNGITGSYGYDSLGNRISLTYSGGNEPLLPAFMWGFDMEGRRIHTKKIHTPTHSQTYGYDHVSQVNNVTQGVMDENNMIPDPLREMNWSFDAEGNWQEVLIDGAMQTREHNNQNQIVSIDGVDLEYDPRGNLANDLEGHTLEWNGRNLLTTYNTNNTYDYDPIGRRVSKTVNGKITSYVYDGWQVIAEFDSEGVTKRYAYGDYIDEPIVMITVKMDVAAGEVLSTDTTYYLEGTNGNVAGVTSNDGELLEYYQYDAYGNKEIYSEKGVDGNWFSSDDVKSESSSVGNSYFFQGRRFDEESGLYYFRYRYYSPELGRFISKDPIGFKAGDINVYRFVCNSPFNFIDTWGLKGKVYIQIAGRKGKYLIPAILDEVEALRGNGYTVITNYEGKEIKGNYREGTSFFENAHKDQDAELIMEFGLHGLVGTEAGVGAPGGAGDEYEMFFASDVKKLKGGLKHLRLVILGSCYQSTPGRLKEWDAAYPEGANFVSFDFKIGDVAPEYGHEDKITLLEYLGTNRRFKKIKGDSPLMKQLKKDGFIEEGWQKKLLEKLKKAGASAKTAASTIK